MRLLAAALLLAFAFAGCTQAAPPMKVGFADRSTLPFVMEGAGEAFVEVSGADRLDLHLLRADQVDAFRAGQGFEDVEAARRLDLTSPTVRVPLAAGAYAWGLSCLERERQCTAEVRMDPPMRFPAAASPSA